uniref:Venom protein n=1 Tax=Hemiscolopendra marginata TaxID=943146 RepID=A0A646QCA9_9MYRI
MKSSVLFLLVSSLVVVHVLISTASPLDDSIEKRADELPYCKEFANENMCEHCSAITKSPIIYRICCNNEEGGFEFCQRLTGRGPQAK